MKNVDDLQENRHTSPPPRQEKVSKKRKLEDKVIQRVLEKAPEDVKARIVKNMKSVAVVKEKKPRGLSASMVSLSTDLAAVIGVDVDTRAQVRPCNDNVYTVHVIWV